MDLNFRDALIKDIGDIHTIHLACLYQICNQSYSQFQLDEWTKGRTPEGYVAAIEQNQMIVAEFEGAVVGFAHAVPGEVEAIFVRPQFNGKGLGRALLERALLKSDNGSSVILYSTLNAKSFYAQFGFKEVETKILNRGDAQIECSLMRLSL